MSAIDPKRTIGYSGLARHFAGANVGGLVLSVDAPRVGYVAIDLFDSLGVRPSQFSCPL